MANSKPLSHLSIDELIGLGYQAIDNALADPAILAALDPAYTAATLGDARLQVEALETATQNQRDRYGDQEGATHSTDAAWLAFHRDVYMPHVGMARIVFRDEPGVLASLGLRGEREDAFQKWVGQVNQFYATLAAKPALAARLAPKGLSEPDLLAAKAAFEALRTQERGQEDDKGEAQQSTRDRDALRRPVQVWLGEFRDTARLLLVDHPDWLERLGFLARSDGGGGSDGGGDGGGGGGPSWSTATSRPSAS